MSGTPIFEILPDTYALAAWFLGNDDADFLQLVYRNATGPWMIRYRFRYHVDNRNFDSRDTKSAYTATVPRETPEDEVLVIGAKVVSILQAAGFAADEVQHRVIKGGPDEIMAALASMNGVEIRTDPDNEPS